jgi:hypothetical protein
MNPPVFSERREASGCNCGARPRAGQRSEWSEKAAVVERSVAPAAHRSGGGRAHARGPQCAGGCTAGGASTQAAVQALASCGGVGWDALAASRPRPRCRQGARFRQHEGGGRRPVLQAPTVGEPCGCLLAPRLIGQQPRLFSLRRGTLPRASGHAEHGYYNVYPVSHVGPPEVRYNSAGTEPARGEGRARER